MRHVVYNKQTNKKEQFGGLPWYSSGYKSKLPVQGAWVQSLVGELDPTYHS